MSSCRTCAAVAQDDVRTDPPRKKKILRPPLPPSRFSDKTESRVPLRRPTEVCLFFSICGHLLFFPHQFPKRPLKFRASDVQNTSRAPVNYCELLRTTGARRNFSVLSYERKLTTLTRGNRTESSEIPTKIRKSPPPRRGRRDQTIQNP